MKQELRKLISYGDTDKAIAKLLTLTQQHQSLHQEVNILANRYINQQKRCKG